MRDGEQRVTDRAAWKGGLNWAGASVVILAGGPSLSLEQVEAVRRWHAAALRPYGVDRRVIAVNLTFRLAPWADVLYACDARWWDEYAREVAEAAPLMSRWTAEMPAADRWGVNYIPNSKTPGLCRHPGMIHQGANSGYQSIGLAYQFGAASIVLLGYDMRRGASGEWHWHADYPKGLKRDLPFAWWLAEFEKMAEDAKAADLRVVNATPGSALTVFPMVTLAEALQ